MKLRLCGAGLIAGLAAAKSTDVERSNSSCLYQTHPPSYNLLNPQNGDLVAKAKVAYVCQQCGRTSPRAMGKCPQCGSWNSMVAEVIDDRRRTAAAGQTSKAVPRRLAEIEDDHRQRIPLSIEEFSRVLGGGIVPGSVVLIGGDPGIGKSTLLLQMVLSLAKKDPILYVSGEESEGQIKARAERLQSADETTGQLFLLTETHLESIVSHFDQVHPRLVVIDSIQTMQTSDLDSSAGTISQVRECASRLQSVAKSSGIAVFLVGHVTKEGAIAGPRVLEHIVDTVLYLEGDSFHAFRLLRSVKNRFGPTSEVGVFEMQTKGMVEVANPSEAFLSERAIDAPGSTISVPMEGTRPMLVEIQGLTSSTSFGNPRRTANGVDFNRLLLTVAVLTRRMNYRLSDQDVFVNVVGGLKINEPGSDLAVAAAIASSLRDQPISPGVVMVGELGLSGEIRSVSQLTPRLREAAKLGFERAIVPPLQKSDEPTISSMQITQVRSLREALREALPTKSH
jgi:DNA repair protein RadA/Sms